MDHVVFLDSEAKELENLLLGNKSMIIRGSSKRRLPHGRVKKGDVLYFINKKEGRKVKARGVVSSVLNSGELTVEESYETIIRNQDKLQLPDNQFDQLAGEKYLCLIGLNAIEEIAPFNINKTKLNDIDDWLPVSTIKMLVI